MLRLTAVNKQFSNNQTAALVNINLDVYKNELLVLLGSSGSGKSTLLKLMNRLLEPSSGEICLHSLPLAEHNLLSLRRSIGYVFQGIGLLPHQTVAENISTVPRLNGQSPDECQRIAHQQLVQVNLQPSVYAERLPHQLSGGQQQRVGVARALATGADLLLMDEPFAALDAITRDQLQQELLSLKETLNKTIVFVTHDLFEAVRLADRIAVLHEGQLHQVDTPEALIKRPESRFVHDLFQQPLQQLQQFQALSR